MTFVPQRVNVTGITQANPAVVTCAVNHNLTTGQVVRLNVPRSYGMPQINNQLSVITVLSNTTFSLQYSQCNPIGNINIDSTQYDPFVNAGTGTPAAFVAVGSASSPILSGPSEGICITSIADATVNNSTTPIPF